jgi:hypothetical protein
LRAISRPSIFIDEMRYWPDLARVALELAGVYFDTGRSGLGRKTGEGASRLGNEAKLASCVLAD